MLRQFLASTSLYHLPLIAMGIFVTIFIAVLLRTSQRRRAAVYRRIADLPLQGDGGERSL
jgi:hypothetical protein